MTRHLPLASEVAAVHQISPDFVRISYASALALGFKSGRFTREFPFGGINLLLNYDDGCRSDCGYCGLARSRAGAYEDKSFIRVEWPLVSTDDLVARMAEAAPKLQRLCISMVTHGAAFRDTLDITRRIRGRVKTPLSILVAPPTLTFERLVQLRAAGADMIGIGLDAVTEQLFRSIRTEVPKGGLDWAQYWNVVDWSREIFGPWQANCHTLVGLGETDRDLLDTFARLLDREVFSFLFCFNPEPDSRMADHPKPPLTRWRRIQLAKFLLEEVGLDRSAFRCDAAGALEQIAAPADLVERAIADGWAFMTNGCTGESGEPGCTRPMGSWRPSEAPRDFPFRPTSDDVVQIRSELELDGFVVPGPGATRTQLAPPSAGRIIAP